MKKKNFVYLCKIDANGRLYNGAWFHYTFLPEQQTDDELRLDEIPDMTEGSSVSDYIWNGKELVYCPLERSDDS
nr:MAG TPA: hypothetical protein [Caudoviricetes sp.]